MNLQRNFRRCTERKGFGFQSKTEYKLKDTRKTMFWVRHLLRRGNGFFKLVESPAPASASEMPRQSGEQRYWNPRFILLNVTLFLLAIASAYLEYVAYPALMIAPYNPIDPSAGFGEHNVVLKLSFLTFQYFSTSRSGQYLVGVPAFDFFQAFVYVIIIVNLVHFWNFKKSS